MFKNKMFALVLGSALLASAGASAEVRYPDQMYTVMTCRDARQLMDAGISVKVEAGGFAGVTEVSIVEETFHGPVDLGTEVVAVKTNVRRPGAPQVYKSQDFVLSVNGTVAPNEKGEFPGSIKGNLKGYELNNQLLCQFYAHTM